MTEIFERRLAPPVNIISKNLCTGCGACANSCPLGCIQMCPDGEGFLYPQVDDKKCVHCNKCLAVCPVANETKKYPAPEIAFACKNLDEGERAASSSGGVFAVLAKAILSRGGVVYGAAMSGDCKTVFHRRVDNENDLAALQGSKYVQSRIGDAYRQVKEDLSASKTVYFSGTPCQVAGLYAYLEKDYENLYTQDLICHGVPSPLVWEKYVCHVEICRGAGVTQASFRDKTLGWHNFSMRVTLDNGTSVQEPLNQNAFLNVFLNNICLRPSCHECAFKGMARAADITLADFWGVEKLSPEKDDDKGISLVFANSPKGNELFDQIKEQLSVWKTDAAAAVAENPAMVRSVKPNEKRAVFMKTIEKKSFQGALDAVWKPPLSERFKEILKKPLRKIKHLFKK